MLPESLSTKVKLLPMILLIYINNATRQQGFILLAIGFALHVWRSLKISSQALRWILEVSRYPCHRIQGGYQTLGLLSATGHYKNWDMSCFLWNLQWLMLVQSYSTIRSKLYYLVGIYLHMWKSYDKVKFPKISFKNKVQFKNICAGYWFANIMYII